MTSPDPEIRPFRPGDEAARMEVCLRTGHAGSDASDLFADGNLVGTIWCMPYLVLEPELASVVSLAGGEPSGYVLGALDSAAFRAAAAAHAAPRARLASRSRGKTWAACSVSRAGGEQSAARLRGGWVG